MNVEAKPRKSMQKLELTWVGKDDPISIEPRILLEDAAKSNTAHDPNTENLLIHGDNLLALKALEAKYAGRVKCIYIDPPYNTGAAFEHYDDNLEHSQWLNLMRPRLELLQRLLASNGFACIQIDDSEGAYLKVLCDEVFGRPNYETTLYVRVRYPDKTLKQDMSYHKEIEQILVYRKTDMAKPNLREEDASYDKFNFTIKTTGEPSQVITLGGKKVEVFVKGNYKISKGEGCVDGLKEIWATGTILDGNSSGRFFRDYLTGRYEEDGYGVLYRVYGIGDDGLEYRYFTGPTKAGATKGKYFQGVPLKKRESMTTKTAPINGFYDLAGSFGNCRLEGGVGFRGGKKPEALLNMILSHFSNPGDLVLDSFLGSGTTAAVAHKMGRRWIGVEMGDHAYTHCKVRLDKVIAGEDKGGITKAVNWQGGGGYRFYELAPTLVKFDMFGEAVINEKYNAEMLAAAVALHEGYEYAPDAQVFWKQAKSETGGKSWLFTTTRHVSSQYLASIAQDMEEGEFLVVVCKSYDSGAANAYPCIKVKKIPQSLLKKCEFGKESYALNVVEDEENVEEEE